MKELPLFVLGLLVRMVLIVLVVPWTHEHWFLPFLTSLSEAKSIDVWAEYLTTGRDPMSFPYGIAYLIVFAPLTLLGNAIGGFSGAGFGLGLTVIALDAAMLWAIRMIAPPQVRSRLYLLYWLSPITLYVGYWHGQLDILPVLLLTCSLILLKGNRLMASAAVMAVAISAKFSMVAATPLVFIFMVGSPRYRADALRYWIAFGLFLGASMGAQYLLPGFRAMALGTPELQKSIAIAIEYGGGLSLYLLPMAYAGLLLLAWRIRRFSFEELIYLIALVFLVLYLLTPAAPGWVMWFAAFLAIHTAKAGLRAGILYLIFSLSFIALHLMVSLGARSEIGTPWDLTHFPPLLGNFPLGEPTAWVFSLQAVAAGALALQMLRERIFQNNFHLATRMPMMIGIAGDSGAGKDTLRELIIDMFGDRSASSISGDDYHSWDRHKPMWRALTHLHPRANDLERFASDALTLGRRQGIRSPHYDHSIGRMTKPLDVPAAEIVIVSGLHALYPVALRQRYNLRIYTDMHEGLRRYLKIRRDTAVRGHPMEKVLRSIETRYADSQLYIQPQKAFADVVVRLEPVRESDVEDFARPPEEIPLRLRVSSRNADDLPNLKVLLVSVCGLHVLEQVGEDGRFETIIEGAPSKQDIEIVARRLAPELEEFLAVKPVWRDAQHGLQQLLILDHLNRLRESHGGTG